MESNGRIIERGGYLTPDNVAGLENVMIKGEITGG